MYLFEYVSFSNVFSLNMYLSEYVYFLNMNIYSFKNGFYLGNDYLFSKKLLLHSRLLGRGSRPARPLVSVLAVGSRCRGSQPTAFYPQTVSSLDGFNVRGSADVR
jgi:hypothetical protein